MFLGPLSPKFLDPLLCWIYCVGRGEGEGGRGSGPGSGDNNEINSVSGK